MSITYPYLPEAENSYRDYVKKKKEVDKQVNEIIAKIENEQRLSKRIEAACYKFFNPEKGQEDGI